MAFSLSPRFFILIISVLGVTGLLHLILSASNPTTPLRIVDMGTEFFVAVAFLHEIVVLGAFTTILILVITIICGIMVTTAIGDYPRKSIENMITMNWKRVAVLTLVSTIYCYMHYLSWLRVIVVVVGTIALASFAILADVVIRLFFIRCLILPASAPPSTFSLIEYFEQINREAAKQRAKLDAERRWTLMNLQTPDGATISAAQYLSHAQESKAQHPSMQKWIIFFLGNGGFYEVIARDAAEYAEQVDANLMLFNFRGVGSSFPAPLSQQDLVTDGRTVFEHLRAKGIHPNNILFHGHSLGGCVATLLRAEFPGGPLISDRSFSSLDKVVDGWLSSTPSPVRAFVRMTLPAVLGSMGWAMDARSTWEKVEKNSLVLFHKKDEIIKYEIASLENSLPSLDSSDDSCNNGNSQQLNSPARIELTMHSASPHNVWLTNDREAWPRVKAHIKCMLYKNTQQTKRSTTAGFDPLVGKEMSD